MDRYLDANPPYLYEAYPSTVFRSPTQTVTLPPEYLARTPGPSWTSIIEVTDTDSDLTKQREGQPIGQRIVLSGRVLDREGEPVPGALIEVWQANGAGRYLDPVDPGDHPVDPNFVGAGRAVSDDEGRYQFITLRPAAYPGPRGRGLYRPSHIHVSVVGPDLSSRLITQCYFPDDPLLIRDPIAASGGEAGVRALTANFVAESTELRGPDSALVYEWDIVLRGYRTALATESVAV
jgi:protocatechuate 3,4-dioxygenase, beta subunit